MSTVAQLIQATGLSSEFCSDLLGVTPQQFNSWMAPDGALPRYAVPLLSTVIGADLDALQRTATSQKGTVVAPPAIWYKLSADPRLKPLDRNAVGETVGLIRRLAFNIHQLQKIRRTVAGAYSGYFGAIVEQVDLSASPDDQAIKAAELFRSMAGFDHEQVGIGDRLRGTLRRLGLLVVESPIRSSRIEGCCFKTTSEASSPPCLFANTYHSTWFRRNAVLAHELCHAIFDVDSEQVSLDFTDDESLDLRERRARIFAQHMLAPTSVLNQYQNRRGFDWGHLNEADLAYLVAHSGAEQKLVLDAAMEAGFIDSDLRASYSAFRLDAELRQISSHALTTAEYMEQQKIVDPVWASEKRTATIGGRTLRLPVPFVMDVLESVAKTMITPGKAAELLMTDKRSLSSNFGITVFGE